jgi:putative addiction module component (TIGR02574 family)
MTSTQISNLSATEKLQLMEALWDDMRQKADDCEIPPEHLEILDARWARVESGESTLLDWDKVKHSIGKS